MESRIIEKFIALIEDSRIKVRGGRGYSAGHPYQQKEINPVYGKSEYEVEEEEEAPSNAPVKVSKAFLDEEEDEK